MFLLQSPTVELCLADQRVWVWVGGGLAALFLCQLSPIKVS
jgi:hypothetical protein